MVHEYKVGDRVIMDLDADGFVPGTVVVSELDELVVRTDAEHVRDDEPFEYFIGTEWDGFVEPETDA